MGTTAEKLTYLNTTKGKIKDSINLTGAGITTEPFRQYAVKLKDAYVDIINNGTDTLYNNFPKVSGSGTDLSLQNTYQAPMRSTLKGNTSQVQLSGKNKLPLEDIDITKNSVRIYTSNGNIYLNGTNSSPIYSTEKLKIFTLKAGTYTSNPNVSGTPNMFLRRSDNDSILNQTNRTFTLSEDTSVYLCAYIGASTYTNYQLYWGLQEGTSYNDYEQYCGGTPSPNPSYPQDIHNVSGNNTIEICGKNLFDKDNANLIDAYLNPTGTKISSASGVKTLYISCKPNTTYTISKVQSDRFVVATGTSVEPNSVMTSFVADYTATKITITSGANDKYIVVFFYRQSGDTLTPEEIMETIQIEYGNQSTTYEAYNGTTYPINLPNGMELCKIGTYQDYIYKDDDKWYLHKEIEKVVYDGSETGWSRTASSMAYSFYKPRPTDSRAPSQTYYCNYFKPTTTYGTNNNTTYIGNTNIIFSNVLVNGEYILTTDDFKTWLSTHNTSVYYQLDTETDTEITDTTLISQLEAIYNANSRNGTTNINQENNDLGFIITASALEKEV